MKSTCPTPAPCVGDPSPSIFQLLALGVGIGGNANFNVFRYQHVDIPNVKFYIVGLSQREDPT